jgi:metal-sulfur cluster biosynthetic enzyme
MSLTATLPIVRSADRDTERTPAPPHAQSTVSGGRDLWSAPLEAHPADPTAATWAALREVLDPEIPISLVDLGLIYGLELDRRTVKLDVTFTATACPCMAFIREDITDRLIAEQWIDHVEIREVWDPPWTRDRISARGRQQLKTLGVGA